MGKKVAGRGDATRRAVRQTNAANRQDLASGVGFIKRNVRQFKLGEHVGTAMVRDIKREKAKKK